MMYRMTTLGLDERLESVLAYLFGWVSGLVLLLIEKNRAVRWHAAQSLVTFGTLSLLMFGVSMLKVLLGSIPLLGLMTDFGLGLLLNVLWWAGVFLWIWLMAMAWVRPKYQLPLIGEWVSRFVE